MAARQPHGRGETCGQASRSNPRRDPMGRTPAPPGVSPVRVASARHVPQKRGMRFVPLPTRLDRYIFRQLFWALIAVTGGLTALIWLTQSLRFVELVVNRGLSLLVVPAADRAADPQLHRGHSADHHLCGDPVRLSAPGGDRELTVMRAAGLSPFALARPALGGGAAGDHRRLLAQPWIVVPDTLASFREFQWEIRNRLAAFLLQDGVFTPISDKLMVYVRSRDPDGTLRGILVDDARDPAVHATILAESRPVGGRSERPARPAAGRQPAGNRPPDRPA